MTEEYFQKFNEKIYENGLNNKNIIKCIKKNSYSSIYGNTSIPSSKEQKWMWTFKVKNNVDDNIYIGISSSFICDQDCFTNEESSNYCFATNGEKWSKGNRDKYHLNSFNQGDIIQMILDCPQKQLSFVHNNKHLGVAYDNIDIGKDINYKMAIIMASKDDELELVNFKQANSDKDKGEIEDPDEKEETWSSPQSSQDDDLMIQVVFHKYIFNLVHNVLKNVYTQNIFI